MNIQYEYIILHAVVALMVVVLHVQSVLQSIEWVQGEKSDVPTVIFKPCLTKQ